jgi:hypothetical protein
LPIDSITDETFSKLGYRNVQLQLYQKVSSNTVFLSSSKTNGKFITDWNFIDTNKEHFFQGNKFSIVGIYFLIMLFKLFKKENNLTFTDEEKEVFSNYLVDLGRIKFYLLNGIHQDLDTLSEKKRIKRIVMIKTNNYKIFYILLLGKEKYFNE